MDTRGAGPGPADRRASTGGWTFPGVRPHHRLVEACSVSWATKYIPATTRGAHRPRGNGVDAKHRRHPYRLGSFR